MTVTALRIALGASVLVLTSGAAWSDGAPASTTQIAALGNTCPAAPAQPASVPFYGAGTTARHTNVMRVRYTATHAMPPKRTAPVMAQVNCTGTVKRANTTLD